MASMLASFTGVSLRPSLTQKRLKVRACCTLCCAVRPDAPGLPTALPGGAAAQRIVLGRGGSSEGAEDRGSAAHFCRSMGRAAHAWRTELTPRRQVQARRPLSVSAVTKKSPAPPPSRFGAAKAAPAAEKAALALVCGECGYVYAGPKAFSAQPASYKCPVCKAPKSAFSEKDTAGVNSLLPVIAAILLVAGGVGVYLSKL